MYTQANTQANTQSKYSKQILKANTQSKYSSRQTAAVSRWNSPMCPWGSTRSSGKNTKKQNQQCNSLFLLGEQQYSMHNVWTTHCSGIFFSEWVGVRLFTNSCVKRISPFYMLLNFGILLVWTVASPCADCPHSSREKWPLVTPNGTQKWQSRPNYTSLFY